MQPKRRLPFWLERISNRNERYGQCIVNALYAEFGIENEMYLLDYLYQISNEDLRKMIKKYLEK